MKDFKIQIEYLKPDALTPYEKNTRKHEAYDVSQIAESIRHFGFDDPIGIWGENNLIVEGHGRLLAAKYLKMDSVPCIRLDHLTDEERRQYAIMHNKTAELSEWDFDNLGSELSELDMTDFDIDFDELDDVPGGKKEAEEDDYDVVLPEEPKAQLGQVYQLGKHRLMCGDSTKSSDVLKLMGGSLADLVVTDPPYNMNYQGAGNTKKEDRENLKIKNDNLSPQEFERFILSAYQRMNDVLSDGGSFYVFYKEMGDGVFIRMIKRAGLTYKQELIWAKSQLVLGGAKYQNIYEPCLFGCKGKSIKHWYGGRKQKSVVEALDSMSEAELIETIKQLLNDMDCDIIREKKSAKNDLHPTMKPIKLLARLIQNSSATGCSVLDLFGGSGSTLIACEQIDRSCFMMEFDPKFVDVIIDRWEKFTGEKAVLLDDDS